MERIKALFKDIGNHIDKDGKLIGSPEEVGKSIAAAEKVAQAMLGCTLRVKGKEFVIRMVELYYGGVADDKHDWYRDRYVYKTSKYVDRSAVQSMGGFRAYIASDDLEDTYNRLDIVIGNEGVPVSLLIRSMWDFDHNVIRSAKDNSSWKKGNPWVVLRSLGLDVSHHDRPIAIGSDAGRSELSLQNTHDKVISQYGYQICWQTRRKKNGPLDGIIDQRGIEWNFYLDK